MKMWQFALVLILIFILFRTNPTSTRSSFVQPQTLVENQGSIDSLYFSPDPSRVTDFFRYDSPSEWAANNLSYSYLGPPNPDYYPHRAQGLTYPEVIPENTVYPNVPIYQ